MLYKNVFEMIGNTPLLEIPKNIHGFEKVNIYAKLEYYNPFGSVKDKTAYGLIRDNFDEIKNGKKIIELSSGNTGRALCTMATILGSSFKGVTNRIRVQEQKEILMLLGGELRMFMGQLECPDPNSPDDPMKVINDEMQKNPGKYFYTDQYESFKNVKIHEDMTGAEILKDLDNKVDYFVCGLGTCGSSRGVLNAVKKVNSNAKIIGTISKGGNYIPGIRNAEEMRDVGLYDKKLYDEIISIDSSEALDYMRILLQKVGMCGGPTTGSTYGGLIKYISENYENIPENSNIVFIACDRFEPYLSYMKDRKPEWFGLENKNNEFCTFKITENQRKSVNYIHPEDLQKELNSPEILIIDTRSNSSFRNISIPGSLNITIELLKDLIDDDNLPFPKNKKIILVCPYGKENLNVSAYLNGKGYNTFVLQGGLGDWIEGEYETESLN